MQFLKNGNLIYFFLDEIETEIVVEQLDNDTSKAESIIDVNSDQLFNNSIFTEYDANDLTSMSSKITKKWRKRWTTDVKPVERMSIEQLVEQREKQEAEEKSLNGKNVMQKFIILTTFLFERTQRRKIAKQFSDGAGVSL
jgi:hypothetical protein